MLRIINESTYCGYGIIQCRLCFGTVAAAPPAGMATGRVLAGAGACFLTRYLPSCRAAALLPPRFSAALAATTLTAAAAGQARAMVTGPGGEGAPGVGHVVNLNIV